MLMGQVLVLLCQCCDFRLVLLFETETICHWYDIALSALHVSQFQTKFIWHNSQLGFIWASRFLFAMDLVKPLISLNSSFACLFSVGLITMCSLLLFWHAIVNFIVQTGVWCFRTSMPNTIIIILVFSIKLIYYTCVWGWVTISLKRQPRSVIIILNDSFNGKAKLQSWSSFFSLKDSKLCRGMELPSCIGALDRKHIAIQQLTKPVVVLNFLITSTF